MANSSSSSSAVQGTALLGLPIFEKLSKGNFALWKLQVLPAIKGAQLQGYLDGSTPAPPATIAVKTGDKETMADNPEYAQWVAHDQQVLSYLLTTMTRDVMMQVATATTAARLWTAVGEIYSSQTRAWAVNTRIALATPKKGNLFAQEYVGKMKALTDEMAVGGTPLSIDELTSYILTGLDQEEYNPLVSAILMRVEPISYSELLAQILSYESRLDLQRGGGNGAGSSVNSASRGGSTDLTGEVEALTTVEEDLEADMVAATLVDGVVAILVAKSHATTAPARCVARMATTPPSAGTGSTPTMCQMKGMSTPPPTPTTSTQIGTLTRAQPTTSPVTSTSSPSTTSTMVLIISEQLVEQV